ncbi:MAG: hypothetical protein ACP5RV_10705 [Thiomonas sp.]
MHQRNLRQLSTSGSFARGSSGRRVYYNRGGRWYVGPGYGGPWHPAERIPPGLRKFRDRDWQRAQDRAYRYDRDPQWRRFRAEGPKPGHGPDRHDRGHGKGHGDDHGKGHGHGHDRDDH